VAPGQRVELLDVLRGIAIFAILLVNFKGNVGRVTPALDAAVLRGLMLLIQASFYPLFSLLFGYGFALQLERTHARDQSMTRFHVRRMFVLFLIGTCHALLIWRGDILVTYALLGLLLLPLQRLKPRTLLLLALVPLLAQVAQPSRITQGPAETIDSEAAADRPAERPELRRFRELIAHKEMLEESPSATRAEIFRAALAVRWDAYQRKLRNLFSLYVVAEDVLMFFIFGFALGKAHVLQNAARYQRSFGIAAMLGLVAAVLGNVAIQLGNLDGGSLRVIASEAADSGLTLAYSAGIAAVYVAARGPARALSIFGAPGRLALTNYLLQSLVMTFVFSGYGLDLQPPTATTWLAINTGFFFIIQVPLSHWWLANFRFGPAEWLWRTLTYGKRQPMRLAATREVSAAHSR
jgi:uncharacterized protein